MKIEKICAGILLLLVTLFCVVYFTLPEQGEQIFIPQETIVAPPIEIPDGYHLVDNYSDVYYIETDEGYRYFWLVQFSDGSYGWQEVDENGNIILPGRGGSAESTPETNEQMSSTESPKENTLQPSAEPEE